MTSDQATFLKCSGADCAPSAELGQLKRPESRLRIAFLGLTQPPMQASRDSCLGAGFRPLWVQVTLSRFRGMGCVYRPVRNRLRVYSDPRPTGGCKRANSFSTRSP